MGVNPDDFHQEDEKVRVRKADPIRKRFVFYEKEEESEDLMIENVDQFRESEGFMLFFGSV